MFFSCRIDNMEARSCDEHLMLNRKHTTAVIVFWYTPKGQKEEACYSIAYWKEDDEGHSLCFVGDRPLDVRIDRDVFWKLIRIGQTFLDEYDLSQGI